VLTLASVVALLAATLALAGAAALILPTHTPGARYYKVTQATIGKTICVKGWTKTIRPPATYTNTLKRVQLAQWHYADQNPSPLRGGPPDLARARRRSLLAEEPRRRTSGRSRGRRRTRATPKRTARAARSATGR
jgi:hypothetical protein